MLEMFSCVAASAGLGWRRRLRYYLSEKASMAATAVTSLFSDKNAYLRLKKRFFLWRVAATL